MNIRQLAQVGLGLLGVWALLTAVLEFLQIGMVIGGGLAPLALALVIPVLLLLGLSYLLIFENARVAAAIFSDLGSTGDRAPADLSRILVALTGVMLLVRAAPETLNLLLALVSVGGGPELRDRGIPRLVGLTISIAAGVYLVRRPGRFIEYLEQRREVLVTE